MWGWISQTVFFCSELRKFVISPTIKRWGLAVSQAKIWSLLKFTSATPRLDMWWLCYLFVEFGKVLLMEEIRQNHLRLVVHPIIYGLFFYIPGAAGCLTSTVWHNKRWHWNGSQGRIQTYQLHMWRQKFQHPQFDSSIPTIFTMCMTWTFDSPNKLDACDLTIYRIRAFVVLHINILQPEVLTTSSYTPGFTNIYLGKWVNWGISSWTNSGHFKC